MGDRDLILIIISFSQRITFVPLFSPHFKLNWRIKKRKHKDGFTFFNIFSCFTFLFALCHTSVLLFWLFAQWKRVPYQRRSELKVIIILQLFLLWLIFSVIGICRIIRKKKDGLTYYFVFPFLFPPQTLHLLLCFILSSLPTLGFCDLWRTVFLC